MQRAANVLRRLGRHIGEQRSGEPLGRGIRGEALWPKLDFLSLMLALFCGTASLPHILIRYYTVKDEPAARKSTVVGIGSIGAPVNTTAVAGMPPSQASLAAAIASMSRQVGAALGVALAGSMAGSGLEGAQPWALAASIRPVFWVIATFGVAIVGLGFASTGARAQASAERALQGC